MAGGGGRDRMNPNPKKPPYGGPLAASPGNSGPYVPEQTGQKPTPQVRPQRPPILQGPPMTQTPPFVPGMPAAKPPMPNVDILQAEKPQLSTPLPPGKPAWQILRESGMPVGGSAAANRAAVRGLPSAGASGAPGVFNTLPAQAPEMGANGRPGGIDGAIQALRAQLGQPGAVGQAVQPPPAGFWTPERIAQARPMDPSMFSTPSGSPTPQALNNFRQNTRGMSPMDIGVQMAGFPKPPGGLDGPGSDLGFQSGGGLLAPTFPPGDGAGPGNPYLDILRQRLGGGIGGGQPRYY